MRGNRPDMILLIKSLAIIPILVVRQGLGTGVEKPGFFTSLLRCTRRFRIKTPGFFTDSLSLEVYLENNRGWVTNYYLRPCGEEYC